MSEEIIRQTDTGKAFEYSILVEFYDRLKDKTKVSVIENEAYLVAKHCFQKFDEREQGKYRVSSSTAVNFLIDLEPRLSNDIGGDDTLELEIVSDSEGQKGDVRDVLLIRKSQEWEIGISAKNNHKAVKHPRLSKEIDFGKEWIGIPCSDTYFEEISPIFEMVDSYMKEHDPGLWRNMENKDDEVYLPLLKSFKKELLRLDAENPNIVPEKLVEYMIGRKDFYKVIKQEKEIIIQAYNMNGTLNLPFKDIKPKAKLQKLKFPTRIIELDFKKDSSNKLELHCDGGWQLSFRIHNASSRVERSLKFDIQLIGNPQDLFVNHIFYAL